jgi:hypothetical protein
MKGSRYIEQNDAPAECGRRSAGLFVLALGLVGLAGSAFADATRAPGNPIGPATVPPSTYERAFPAQDSTSANGGRAANLPGPAGTLGNLVVTGNVSGGKYFRGFVPYGSATSLGAPLGSTQLDPFLRYTSVPPELGGYAGGYNPFYSPTGTAATTLPGYGGTVLVPSSPRVVSGQPADRPADVLTLSEMSPYQAGEGLTGTAAYGSYGSSAGGLAGQVPGQNLELPVADGRLNAGRESTIRNPQSAITGLTPPGVTTNSRQATLQNNGLMTPEDYRRQLEQLQQDIERVKANAQALEQSLKTSDAVSTCVTGQQPAQTAESDTPAAPGGAVTLPPGQPSDLGSGVRPDDSLLRAPRVPDQAPVPGASQSVGGLRVTGVKWLPQKEQAKGVSPGEAGQFRTPLFPTPAGMDQSSPASAAPLGRIDAVFAPQGRSSAATGSLWTEVPALQVQQASPAVPGISNPALGGLQRPVAPPAPGVKPSPEQVSAFIARLRATSAGGNPAANPAGNGAAGALANPSQPFIADRLLQTYRSPSGTLGLPGDDANARVTTSGSQALGMLDNSATFPQRSGTAGTFTQDRFDRCLGAAELYLRQGQYYRAAESFTLAAAYKPSDGRALLGKSYALFGAGEYLSSALYLARALELDVRAVLGRSDLVDAIGGPAVFAARITDLERCARTADAPQLQFLLAYVYGQMNRPAEAKAALEAAEKQLPPSPALDLLKAVVARP